MATVPQIKAALTHDHEGNTITVGPNAVARVVAWYAADYEMDEGDVTADMISHWLWRQLRGKVLDNERRIAENAIAQPDELEDTL